MLIERIRGSRIGPLGAFDLDLGAVPAGIVVIRAPNGRGKSVLVGCIPGAFYRDVPTKGPLAGLATDRTAFVEVTAAYKDPFVIRQTVDGTSGKGETLITTNGAPVMATTKVTDGDAWVREHLPPPEVYFSAFFAPQQSAGFLDLPTGDRKGVILRVLGIARYEALAEAARAKAKQASERLATLKTVAATLEPTGSATAVGAARDALETAQRLALEAETALGTAEVGLRVARERAEKIAAAHRDGVEAFNRHRAASQRATKARTAASEALRRLTEAEGTAAKRGAVDAAAARVKEADHASEVAEEAAAAKDREAAEAERGAQEAKKAWAAAHEKRKKNDARRGVLASKMGDRQKVEGAVRRLPGLRQELADADGKNRRAKEACEAAEAACLAGALDRIPNLRGGLERIRDGFVEPATEARLTLRVDDESAKNQQEAPAKAQAAREAAAVALRAFFDAQAALQAAEVLAARQGEIDALDSEQAGCDIAAEEAEHELEEAGEREKALTDRAKAAREAASETRKSARPADADDVAMEALEPAVASAEARLPDLREALRNATLEKEAAEAALLEAPDPGAVAAAPDLSREEAAVRDAKRREQECRTALGSRESALKLAEEASERLAAKRASAVLEALEAEDFARLAQDLGRKGLQALEIDAAGPELTAIVNDLLRQAFGVRYTLTLETTRPRKQDGELVEVFDIRCIDLENGWEGPATGLSGGQRTIVGEALRLALTTLACRRAGVSKCTLVRDESGAALDQDNAPAYVAMLRRAASLVGARQVLLVTHDPVIWNLADAIVGIDADGKVVVL